MPFPNKSGNENGNLVFLHQETELNSMIDYISGGAVLQAAEPPVKPIIRLQRSLLSQCWVQSIESIYGSNYPNRVYHSKVYAKFQTSRHY